MYSFLASLKTVTATATATARKDLCYHPKGAKRGERHGVLIAAATRRGNASRIYNNNCHNFYYKYMFL